MPTSRVKSRLTGRANKFILTPADTADSMVGVLDAIYNSTLDNRWEVIYESPAGTITVTQGSPEITWSGGSFDDYLGDVWVAFGASGFTPTKFYKIEAVHTATTARLEHYITEATASGRHFVLARPIRYTVEFEPGNYDFENYPLHYCSNTACVSLVGISTDAQLFFDSSFNLQGIVRLNGNGGASGELNIKRLGIYCTTKDSDFAAQQPFRLQGGLAGCVNLLMERCYIHSPNTDFIAGQGSGTVILRNNHGIVGFDGIGGINTPDKLFMHGNVLRNLASPSAVVVHSRTGIAVLTNAKAAGFGTREVWIHGNQIEIFDDGSEVPFTAGIGCKVSTALPTTPANFVSSHNHIIIDSANSGVESETSNFAAGLYAWDQITSGASSAPVIESHGDVIELRGGGTNLYGYKANSGQINIWNRPDAHAVSKEDGGTINDDGVGI